MSTILPAERIRSLNPALSAIHQVPGPLGDHVREHFFGPFEEQFNRFFDDFFAVKRKPLSHGFPKVDLYTHDDKFVIEFAMAGVDPSDVTIELSDEPHEFGIEYGRKLKVSGKMSAAFEHKQDAVYHVKEMTRKHFTRTILLADYVKSDPVATFKNGMLTLTFELPKKEEEKPKVKTIEIQTGDSAKTKRLDFTDADMEMGGK